MDLEFSPVWFHSVRPYSILFESKNLGHMCLYDNYVDDDMTWMVSYSKQAE